MTKAETLKQQSLYEEESIELTTSGNFWGGKIIIEELLFVKQNEQAKESTWFQEIQWIRKFTQKLPEYPIDSKKKKKATIHQELNFIEAFLKSLNFFALPRKRKHGIFDFGLTIESKKIPWQTNQKGQNWKLKMGMKISYISAR